jgi:hypothetical protein
MQNLLHQKERYHAKSGKQRANQEERAAFGSLGRPH